MFADSACWQTKGIEKQLLADLYPLLFIGSTNPTESRACLRNVYLYPRPEGAEVPASSPN